MLRVAVQACAFNSNPMPKRSFAFRPTNESPSRATAHKSIFGAELLRNAQHGEQVPVARRVPGIAMDARA
jgi:hypothetical protein